MFYEKSKRSTVTIMNILELWGVATIPSYLGLGMTPSTGIEAQHRSYAIFKIRQTRP